MTKWSGLAPAVDAHIAHWARADRAKHLIDQAVDNDYDMETSVRAILTNEWLHRWILFGMSYGVPDANGVPQVIVMKRGSDMSVPYSDGAGRGPMPEHTIPVTLDGQTITGREQMDGNAASFGQGISLANRELTMLKKAVSHYVSAEVVHEVNEAARLAHPEPLYETDVFTPFGFAVFEEAVEFHDLDPVSGATAGDLFVHIRAIGWAVTDGIGNLSTNTMGKGVSVFFYTTRQDYERGYYASMVASGRLPPFTPAELDDDDAFIPVEVLPWSFGVPWTTRRETGFIPGTVPEPIGEQRRWFYAFQRLMWQRIIVAQRAQPHRHEVRRFERTAKRKEILEYTVLRLRRLVEQRPTDLATGTGRQLDRRVLARGYWMYAHVKSLGPARDAHGVQIPETHRWTWVEPAWRGPEDGPIGAMEHATSVVR